MVEESEATESTATEAESYQPPADHAEQLSPLLSSGERVLWSARPDPKAFRRTCYGPARYLIPVVLLIWTCILGVAVWSTRDWGEMQGFVLATFLPFVVFGFVITKLSYDALLSKAGQVLYAVTDRRVIVEKPKPSRLARHFFRSTGRTFSRGAIRFVHVKAHTDGFGNVAIADGFGPQFGFQMMIPINGFVGIAKPDEVAQLIRKQEYAPHVSARANLVTRFFAWF